MSRQTLAAVTTLLVVVVYGGLALAEHDANFGLLKGGPQQGAAARKIQLERILSRFEQAQTTNPAHARPYVLTRQYSFFHENSRNPESEVVAEVTFLPPNRKTYEILTSRGQGRATSVVTHILENESQLARDRSRAELSRENYDFELLPDSTLNGRRCYVLGLEPKRAEHNLFRGGKAYIDMETFRLLRLEGEPAKSPSWWLKRTYVVISFGDVAGLWLPVASEASADVRLFGRYEVASKKIGEQVGTEVAVTSSSSQQTPAVVSVGRHGRGPSRSTSVLGVTLVK